MHTEVFLFYLGGGGGGGVILHFICPIIIPLVINWWLLTVSEMLRTSPEALA